MLAILLAIVGLVVGFGAAMFVQQQRKGSAEAKTKKELEKAKKEANRIRKENPDKIIRLCNGTINEYI